MGFVAGDRLDWRRWWVPRGTTPHLSDGLLFEPTSDYFPHLNPDACELSELVDTRCLVLLGGPGAGKSDELARESDRLSAAGADVLAVDLGALASWAELDHLVAAELEQRLGAGVADVALVLDSFDEAVVDIVNLADVLARVLAGVDRTRLTVRVGARPAVWSAVLEEKLRGWWPRSFAAYTLAPLSRSDIARAAATELDDPTSFMDDVRRLGLGPLAARPIGLKLLLAGVLRSGKVSDSRVEAYAAGAFALAAEHGKRRIERGRGGPDEKRRVAAASTVAVFSLLCGRPRVVARRALADEHSLALETISGVDGVELSDLEVLADSALFTASGSGVEWAHRSLAEYLAARRLAELPLKTALNLITHPDRTDEVVPQLGELAAWIAALSPEFFTWIAERHPGWLLNADLPMRTEAQRRTVGATVIAALRGNEPPADQTHYAGLDYPGIVDDLKDVVSDQTRPEWARREAMTILRDNGRRELDDELAAIVEDAIGEDEYEGKVSLARWAVLALEGSTEAPVLDRLRAAFDAGGHRSLREDLVRLLGSRLSTPDILAGFSDAFDRSDSTSRGMAGELLERLSADRGAMADLLRWLRDQPAERHDNEAFVELGAGLLQTFLTSGSGTDDAGLWQLAVQVSARQLTEHHSLFELTIGQLRAADPHRRHRFAHDLLQAVGAELWAAADIRKSGLILPEDLDAWLARHAAALKSERDSDVTEAAVWAIATPSPAAVAVARTAATADPTLEPLVDRYFGPAAIARYEQGQRDSSEREAREARDPATRVFSVSRLDTGLAQGDWPVVAAEIKRPLSAESRTRRVHGAPPDEHEAWRVIDAARRDSLLRLGVDYLKTATPDYQRADGFCDAFALAERLAPAELASLPSSTWLTWLPHVIELPGRHDAAARVLHFAAEADRSAVERLVLGRLTQEVARAHVFVLDRLGTFWTGNIADALHDLAANDETRPFATGQALAALLNRDPERALRVADKVAARRGQKPRLAKNEARDLDSPNVRRWARAVSAAAAVCSSEAYADGFDSFFAIARVDVEFFQHVVRESASPIMGRTFLRGLDSDRLADLYLWARSVLPRASRAPGVVMAYDPVKEFAGDVFRMLTSRTDASTAHALDRVAQATDDDWHRAAARDAWIAVRAASWAPLDVEAVAAMLADARRRLIRSESELAAVLLEALREVQEDCRRDTKIRRRYWHRQRIGNQWHGWVPLEEPELSDELALSLAEKLGGRVVLGREVELQPRFGEQPGQLSDVLASVSVDRDEPIQCVIEVKGNWNSEVTTAIRTQLVDRYLNGKASRTGIYVVAFFDGSGWDAQTDRDRRQRASKYAMADLTDALGSEARALAESGVTVHVVLLDLRLESVRLPSDAETA